MARLDIAPGIGPGRLLACDRCGLMATPSASADIAAMVEYHAGEECDFFAAEQDLRDLGLHHVYITQDQLELRDAGIELVPGPTLRGKATGFWAPDWAMRILRSVNGAQHARAALLRRLARDAVAAAMVASHPDAIERLLAAEAP